MLQLGPCLPGCSAGRCRCSCEHPVGRPAGTCLFPSVCGGIVAIAEPALVIPACSCDTSVCVSRSCTLYRLPFAVVAYLLRGPLGCYVGSEWSRFLNKTYLSRNNHFTLIPAGVTWREVLWYVTFFSEAYPRHIFNIQGATSSVLMEA